MAGPSFRQRDVGGLKGHRVGRHVGREGPVHETLDLGNAAEIRRELQHPAAALIEMVAHSPVGADVRTAEPVDGLLRVADDEQLARLRSCLAPVHRRGVVRGQQQEDLGLYRNGVLELVDENSREPLLEILAHCPIAAKHVACVRQQVDEIQRPLPVLERLVSFNRRRKLLLQQGGQVGVGISPELQQLRMKRVAGRKHLRARCRAVSGAIALSRLRQPVIVGQVDQPRLPAVEIVLTERLLESNLTTETPDTIERLVQVVSFGSIGARVADPVHPEMDVETGGRPSVRRPGSPRGLFQPRRRRHGGEPSRWH